MHVILTHMSISPEPSSFFIIHRILLLLIKPARTVKPNGVEGRTGGGGGGSADREMEKEIFFTTNMPMRCNETYSLHTMIKDFIGFKFCPKIFDLRVRNIFLFSQYNFLFSQYISISTSLSLTPSQFLCIIFCGPPGSRWLTGPRDHPNTHAPYGH